MARREKDKQYHIWYKGKVLDTNYWEPVSDEEFVRAREEYYAKPDKELVLKQLSTIFTGGLKIDHVARYYFRELMSKVMLKYNKWTIHDVFSCKELVEHMSAKAKQNTNIYPVEWPLSKKMYKMFSIAGKRLASPPTNFLLKTVDDVLAKYNFNGNWYDYSCGWGVRMMGAWRNKVNYFGTDPNHELCEKLWELRKDCLSVNDTGKEIQVLCQGSEKLNPEWRGKMGLAFSSPPYFDVEDYGVGEQSYKPGMEYADWVRRYVAPTILCIREYLVPGGFFLVNIKNMADHNLADDWGEIAKRCGLEFVGTENVHVHRRPYGTPNCNGKNHWLDNDEKTYVFRKEQT